MLDPARKALDYLRRHHVMTLATHGPQGLWAAAVFYVNQEFDLYFLSSGHTRHGQNIAVNPRVSATIQEDYAGWQGIQGIQLEGVVTQLTGPMRQEAVACYVTKYPFLAQPEPTLQQALEKVNWYHLVPDKLYFVDNTLGLGHRDEIGLSSR